MAEASPQEAKKKDVNKGGKEKNTATLSKLSNNSKVAIASVVSTQGSVPGKVGAKLAISENGKIFKSLMSLDQDTTEFTLKSNC